MRKSCLIARLIVAKLQKILPLFGFCALLSFCAADLHFASLTPREANIPC